MKLEFRHQNQGKDWHSVDLPVSYAEEAAEWLAQKYWEDNPCEPEDFKFKVEIRIRAKERRFTVIAENVIDFRGSELFETSE